MMMVAYAILVILYISSTYYCANGLSKNIFNGEEIHAKSKIFDDTTTRKTEFLYIECIDIHKQPTFHHPMLKNHKIQMEPSFKMERDARTTLRYNNEKKSGFVEDDVCPKGSVPIQRRKGGVMHPLTLSYPGQHFATMNTGKNQETYRGGSAVIYIEQPLVQPDQFSGGLIWVVSGPPNEINVISVGWMVNPKLYGDNRSRATGFWTGNGYKNGCYNALCPGFVQIHPYKYLGRGFTNVSSPTQTIAGPFSIIQDQLSGNWWLMIGDEKIGYWPKELFTHLNRGANISFGGVTYAPSGQSSPPMGKGTFPTSSGSTSSIFKFIKTVDANYHLVYIDYKEASTFIDGKRCYGLSRWGYDPDYGKAFSYGGPGGEYCGI